MRRIFMINAYDYTHLSGKRAWDEFKKTWTVKIFPVSETEKYKHFFAHLKVETSVGIAWGITGMKEMYLFVNDSNNPFITRSNAMPIGHELIHALYQMMVGTGHINRRYDTPDGRFGSRGPAATVIVHDNWYGSKITKRFWISVGIGWLPITYPYIPIWKAKEIYSL